MDNLDRMYRHLVRTIRARFPQYLTEPFNVAELQQNVLPYRLHRRELGLETNEDYEITVTELLAGTRDYLIVDDQMRDGLRKQLSSANPDPSAYRQFASASVALAPAALRSLEIGPDEEALMKGSSTAAPPPPRTPTPVQPAAASPAKTSPVRRTPGPPITAPTGVRRVTPEAGDRCRTCGEALPAGRAITFCPHCGQNVTTTHCLGCGSELEVDWKFCPTCGRPAASS